MDISQTPGRILYEELRLLTKDTFEAIYRLKRICTDRNVYYVFVNDHIGDVLIALGYLKAFRIKNNIDNLTLVITQKYAGIAEYYDDDYERIIYLPQQDLYRVFLLGGTNFGEKYLLKEFPNVVFVNPADAVHMGFYYLKNYPDMNLEKMIRHGCFKLDENAEFIPLHDNVLNQNRADKKNALLITESRTVETGSLLLYEMLVPKLINLGYTVYTNTENINACIKGTQPIYISIDNLREFIGNGAVIGVRSGLHDLLLYQDCIAVAVYPENYAYNKLFSLDMMPKAIAKYKEIMQSGNNAVDCKTIENFVGG